MKAWRTVFPLVCILALTLWASVAFSQPVPGGTLDPTTIPKYETPLVIPPVMKNNGTPDSYDIAVRQFQQQILPGGIWNALGFTTAAFPATTVWSYGPAVDPLPPTGVAPDTTGVSQFNYPAFTIETMSNVPVAVRWINDLKDPITNDCLPHLLPIDQTLHWANPPMDCRMGDPRTDCSGKNPNPYIGPVPIVTHVHGAHVDPHSDGYPEAWWLPLCNQASGYATHGGLFDDVNGTNVNPGDQGFADYLYRQDQPATTLWYHDHSLGMTRSNVYAGPAGFWLIRGGLYDRPRVAGTRNAAKLPGPAPKPGQSVLELNLPTHNIHQKIREIPIVIQDRSFNVNGSLFYPDNRAFFEGLVPGELDINFVPDSDIAPIWNPEAFFNVMVVNGTAWPELEVAPALYRFRFLNGCNSRFLWLKFDNTNATVPVWQIGAEQGFLPSPLSMINDLDGSGDGTAQILMGLAERADTIVDFRELPTGTIIELLNIGPDEPFGGGVPCPPGQNPDDNPGCGDFAAADPGTTGRVMRFRVNSALLQPQDARTTPPNQLALSPEPGLAGPIAAIRKLSLNEGESEVVYVEDVGGNLVQVPDSTPPDCSGGGEPFGPKEALLGIVDASGYPVPLKWTDNTVSLPVNITMTNGDIRSVRVTENPTLGNTEQWDIYNVTADAHPIHLHLVRFEVIDRQALGLDVSGEVALPLVLDGPARPREAWERGFKDTVISYPGEVTRIKALFDIAGLYVWHCHIVEHEDNEMMRPYVVSP